MKSKQPMSRPHIRKSVAHTLPQRTVQLGMPEQATTRERLAVRTGIKAGPLLLSAGLLGNGAAAGGGAIPS